MNQRAFVNSMGLHRESESMFDWAYRGVDNTLPGNGGIECRDFLGLSQRCWESVIASGVAIAALVFAVPRLRLPCDICPKESSDPLGKRILLIAMCLTFGIELGFKFATGQMIWIGNPCHLATMVQIFILAAPPSRVVTAAFRLQMHMLTGAPLAILFPVVNTRLLPFETAVYYLQHILMLVIPFYLMSTGAPFVAEQLNDFSWAMTSFGFLFIYHFLPLQLLAYLSHVNLNNMLCPAVSDPFHGQFYRLFAVAHQIILIPLQGKLLVVLARMLGIYQGDVCRSCCGACPTGPCTYCCQMGCGKCCVKSCYNVCGNNIADPSLNNGRVDTDVEDSGYVNGGSSVEGVDSVNYMFDKNVNKADSEASQERLLKEKHTQRCSGHGCQVTSDADKQKIRPAYDNVVSEEKNGDVSCGCICDLCQPSVQHIVNGKLVDSSQNDNIQCRKNGSPRRRRRVKFDGRQSDSNGRVLTSELRNNMRNGHSKTH